MWKSRLRNTKTAPHRTRCVSEVSRSEVCAARCRASGVRGGHSGRCGHAPPPNSSKLRPPAERPRPQVTTERPAPPATEPPRGGAPAPTRARGGARPTPPVTADTRYRSIARGRGRRERRPTAEPPLRCPRPPRAQAPPLACSVRHARAHIYTHVTLTLFLHKYRKWPFCRFDALRTGLRRPTTRGPRARLYLVHFQNDHVRLWDVCSAISILLAGCKFFFISEENNGSFRFIWSVNSYLAHRTMCESQICIFNDWYSNRTELFGLLVWKHLLASYILIFVRTFCLYFTLNRL